MSKKEIHIYNCVDSIFKLIRLKGQLRSFKKGEYLKHSNNKKQYAIYLESGFTILLRPKEAAGKSKIIRFVHPGETLFSELAINENAEVFDWKALSKTKAYFLDIDTLKAALKLNPKLQLDLFQIATKNLKRLDSSAANRMTLPLKYQFFIFFEEMLEIASVTNLNVTPINRTLLGNYFGCSKSSLSRMFSFFVEQNVVSEEEGGFIINQMLLHKIKQKGEMP